MTRDYLKNVLAIFFLSFLCISAFFIRLENFKNSPARTIDEIVYYRMGAQVLDQGLSGYQTIPYGQELTAKGRPLPDYFFRPLFQHPPLFTFLVAFSMSLFGKTLLAAGYVSLLLATLMIPMIYVLGTLIANRFVGLLAALFLWLDPVSIICSQKVWMDTTIAFFTLLSIVFFVAALKKQKDFYFILSAIAVGAAANTKLTGILIEGSIVLFALLYRRDLFKNKIFLLSLLFPFALLIPWFNWNHQVYGQTFLKILYEPIKGLLFRLATQVKILIPIFLMLGLGIFILVRQRTHKTIGIPKKNNYERALQSLSLTFGILFLVFFLKDNLWRSLHLTYLPSHSWQQGLFGGASPNFYFGRLIEFSFLYVFSYIALLAYHPQEDSLMAIIRLSAAIILLFFVTWGNYQSRYVLSSIPFLILLATHCLVQILKRSENLPLYSRLFIKSLIIFILCYSFLKMNLINVNLSYPNDLCYF